MNSSRRDITKTRNSLPEEHHPRVPRTKLQNHQLLSPEVGAPDNKQASERNYRQLMTKQSNRQIIATLLREIAQADTSQMLRELRGAKTQRTHRVRFILEQRSWEPEAANAQTIQTYNRNTAA